MQEYVTGRNGSESRPSAGLGPLACLSDMFSPPLPPHALGACFPGVLAECLLGEQRRHLSLDWVRGGDGFTLLEPRVPGMWCQGKEWRSSLI